VKTAVVVSVPYSQNILRNAVFTCTMSYQTLPFKANLIISHIVIHQRYTLLISSKTKAAPRRFWRNLPAIMTKWQAVTYKMKKLIKN